MSIRSIATVLGVLDLLLQYPISILSIPRTSIPIQGTYPSNRGFASSAILANQSTIKIANGWASNPLSTTSSSPFSDSYTLNGDTLIWTKLSTPILNSTVGGQLAANATAYHYIGGANPLYAGSKISNLRSLTISNVVEIGDGPVNNYTLSGSCTGGTPASRVFHSCSFDNSTLIWCLGGVTGSTTASLSNQLINFNTTSGCWSTSLPYANISAHTLSYSSLNKSLIVFGGSSVAPNLTNSMYLTGNPTAGIFAYFSLLANSWTNITIPSNGPSLARIHHSASIASNNLLYIYGGTSVSNGSVVYNDFWSYNISSASWTNRTSTVNGSSILPTFSPNGRYGHSSIAYGSHIFIWGGWNASNVSVTTLNAYNIYLNKWTTIYAANVTALPTNITNVTFTITGWGFANQTTGETNNITLNGATYNCTTPSPTVSSNNITCTAPCLSSGYTNLTINIYSAGILYDSYTYNFTSNNSGSCPSITTTSTSSLGTTVTDPSSLPVSEASASGNTSAVGSTVIIGSAVGGTAGLILVGSGALVLMRVRSRRMNYDNDDNNNNYENKKKDGDASSSPMKFNAAMYNRGGKNSAVKAAQMVKVAPPVPGSINPSSNNSSNSNNGNNSIKDQPALNDRKSLQVASVMEVMYGGMVNNLSNANATNSHTLLNPSSSPAPILEESPSLNEENQPQSQLTNGQKQESPVEQPSQEPGNQQKVEEEIKQEANESIPENDPDMAVLQTGLNVEAMMALINGYNPNGTDLTMGGLLDFSSPEK